MKELAGKVALVNSAGVFSRGPLEEMTGTAINVDGGFAA